MNLLDLIKPQNQAFKNYASIQEKIVAVSIKRDVATDYFNRLGAIAAEAQKNFDDKPSADSLAKLHKAINDKKSWENSPLPMSIGHAVDAQIASIKTSPESRKVYADCFRAVEEGLAAKIATLERSIQKALADAGVDGNGFGEPTVLQKLRTDLTFVREGREFIENTMTQPLETRRLQQIEQVLSGELVDFVGSAGRPKSFNDPFIAKHQPTQADLDRQQAESAAQTIFFHGAV